MSVTVNTGYACNNRCLFCDQGDLRSSVAEPSGDAVRASLARARELGDEVALSGGEVTLRADMPDLLREAVRLGFRRIELVTNGRMFSTPELARAAVEAGAGRLLASIALHGDTAAAHDFHTGAKGSFAQAMRGLLNLRKAGGVVSVTTVVTRSNFRTAPALAESSAAVGAARHKWSFPSPTGSLAPNLMTLFPRYSLAAPYVAAAVELGRKNKVDARIKGAPPCVFPESVRAFVDPVAAQPVPPLGEERIAVPPRAHGKPCEGCTEKARCPGPWEAYTKEYGWAEIAPIAPPAALAAAAP